MFEVHKNLFIGKEVDCTFQSIPNLAIIHACKHPCHTRAIGYKGNILSSHPNYLLLEREKHLFLNMVDMEKELLPKFTHPIMKAAMLFIEKFISQNKILVHCNQGQSRSPSIVLVYLAGKGYIPKNSFHDARRKFEDIYANYYPATGIAAYMNRNWLDLMDMLTMCVQPL